MIPFDAYPTQVTTATDIRISSPGVWIVATTSSTPTVMLPPRAPDVATLEDRPPTNAYVVAVRPGARATTLAINTGSGDTIRYGSTTATTLTINPGEAVLVVDDGGAWQALLMSNPAFHWRKVSVRTNSTVTVDLTTDTWVYAGGSATTWTLPAVANNAGMTLTIRNRTTTPGQAITVNPAGSDKLYTTSEQTSATVADGATLRLLNDGTYWLVV